MTVPQHPDALHWIHDRSSTCKSNEGAAVLTRTNYEYVVSAIAMECHEGAECELKLQFIAMILRLQSTWFPGFLPMELDARLYEHSK